MKDGKKFSSFLFFFLTVSIFRGKLFVGNCILTKSDVIYYINLVYINHIKVVLKVVIKLFDKYKTSPKIKEE